MLVAIATVLGVTWLEFIPVPIPVSHITIMHIAAILSRILEGQIVGALVGLIFGVYGFLNSINPMFTELLIAILPRIFIGIAAYYFYAYLWKNSAIGAELGVLTSTIVVLALATLRGYLRIKVSAALQ
jgi:uncharacterized membrane protein